MATKYIIWKQDKFGQTYIIPVVEFSEKLSLIFCLNNWKGLYNAVTILQKVNKFNWIVKAKWSQILKQKISFLESWILLLLPTGGKTGAKPGIQTMLLSGMQSFRLPRALLHAFYDRTLHLCLLPRKSREWSSQRTMPLKGWWKRRVCVWKSVVSYDQQPS